MTFISNSIKNLFYPIHSNFTFIKAKLNYLFKFNETLVITNILFTNFKHTPFIELSHSLR